MCQFFNAFIVGILKALLGLVFPVAVGQLGVCLITRGRHLDHYYEKDLQGMVVIHDDAGVPVHPTK